MELQPSPIKSDTITIENQPGESSSSRLKRFFLGIDNTEVPQRKTKKHQLITSDSLNVFYKPYSMTAIKVVRRAPFSPITVEKLAKMKESLKEIDSTHSLLEEISLEDRRSQVKVNLPQNNRQAYRKPNNRFQFAKKLLEGFEKPSEVSLKLHKRHISSSKDVFTFQKNKYQHLKHDFTREHKTKKKKRSKILTGSVLEDKRINRILSQSGLPPLKPIKRSFLNR